MSKIIVFILLFFAVSYAQVDISSVTVRGGVIRTFQEDVKYKYAFYSEYGIEGNFLLPELRWNLYFGYWDDKADKQVYKPDRIMMSNSCSVYGIKLSYMIWDPFNKFHIAVTFGAAYNIKDSKNIITGENLDSKKFLQPNVGLKISFDLTKKLFLTSDTGTQIGTGKENLGRPFFLIGAGYNF